MKNFTEKCREEEEKLKAFLSLSEKANQQMLTDLKEMVKKIVNAAAEVKKDEKEGGMVGRLITRGAIISTAFFPENESVRNIGLGIYRREKEGVARIEAEKRELIKGIDRLQAKKLYQFFEDIAR